MTKKPGQTELKNQTAKPEDTEFARQAHHQAYHDVVVSQFGKWDTAMQDKFFEAAWKNGLHHEIIMLNKQPCGYYALEETDDKIILHELVIRPEFQNRGIGSHFLKIIIQAAKIKKIPIELQVLKANRAKDWYAKFGFAKTSQTETHLKMEFEPYNNK